MKLRYPLPARHQGGETDEFVQRHSAIHGRVVVRSLHMVVYGRAAESEDQGLVAHQRLVVGLGRRKWFARPAGGWSNSWNSCPMGQSSSRTSLTSRTQ